MSMSAYEHDYIRQAQSRPWYRAYDKRTLDELRTWRTAVPPCSLIELVLERAGVDVLQAEELTVLPGARGAGLGRQVMAHAHRELHRLAAVAGGVDEVAPVPAAAEGKGFISGLRYAWSLPVARFVHPTEFDRLREIGERMGFSHVASGPMVRSSYHADQQAHGVLQHD